MLAPKTDQIQLTGNPFVDVGLAVIASIAKLDSIDDLTLTTIRETHKGFENELLDINSKIKNFTMIFTTNSFLVHPSMKPREVRRPAYQAVLNCLLNAIGSETLAEVCESCGNSSSVDFDALCTEALAEILPERRFRSIGRDWFPLAGSLGSDAQALPAASRSPNLCAKCLFAVHYLPLGLILLNGRLAAFQSTDIDLWYYIVDDFTQKTIERTSAGDYSTQKRGGNKRVIFQLLNIYEDMLHQSEAQRLFIRNDFLFVWRFSNSGANPDCEMDILPNNALAFLNDAVNEGLRSELTNLVNSENNPYFSLYQCLIDGRDYPNLYPSGKRPGASIALFRLYQTAVGGWSEEALNAAARIAYLVSRDVDQKQLKKIQKEEAFKSQLGNRALVKKAIIEATRIGKSSFNDYNMLFPRVGERGVSVSSRGWNLIRYYLHHVEGSTVDSPPAAEIQDEQMSHVIFLASAIYDRNVRTFGPDRLQRIIAQVFRRNIEASWLRREFTRLAEDYQGFSYRDWKYLVENEQGRSTINELLFQVRLLLIQYLYRGGACSKISPRTGIVLHNTSDTTGLPPSFSTYVQILVGRYKQRVGNDGVQTRILQQLMLRRIGLTWFKRHFQAIAESCGDRFNDEIWEGFLRDEDGGMHASERLFQLHLAVANLYREARLSTPT